VTPRATRTLLLALLATAAWVVLILVTYRVWIHRADHRDFYPLWSGARQALLEGRDLYDLETTRHTQLRLYGRELPPDRDQQGFAYPAILLPVLLPFWYVNDVEIATAAWEATSVLLLLGALLLVRKAWGNPPRWGIALLLLWYYPTLMLFQAQITAVPLSAIAACLWLFQRRRDALAGAVLVFGFIKPDLMLIPTLVFLAFALWQRRWRFVAGMVTAALVLFGVSFMLQGWWIPRWFEALGRYTVYAQNSWALGTAWGLSPLVAALLVGFALFALVRLRRAFEPVITASIPLGMLLLPQTPIWGLTMLTLPLPLAWRGRAKWGVLGVWIIGWLLIVGSDQTDWWRVQNMLLPALTLGVVAWGSRER